jgi:hypothetical protein
MSFPYKNPISPNQLTGQQSLDRTKTYGTNYSILSTGGYMEVFSLNQLYYTIPPATFGVIEFSGNTIPITFSKGTGTPFSLDTLILQPDNISSGRRKLGMMVYVYEENQLYQFIIDNYDTLWNAATGSTGTTIISDFGTTIKADSPENKAFISGWTANTIDGVSGQTYSTAVWKKLSTGGSSGIIGGQEGQILSKDSSTNFDYTWKYYNEVIQVQILSEGNTIADGFKGYRFIDKDMNITSAQILSNGDITLSFTLVVSSTTIGNIGLSASTSITDTTLTGWNTNLTAGDFLEIYIDSPGGISTASKAVVILILNANKKI